jgi:hypothetical protein
VFIFQGIQWSISTVTSRSFSLHSPLNRTPFCRRFTKSMNSFDYVDNCYSNRPQLSMRWRQGQQYKWSTVIFNQRRIHLCPIDPIEMAKQARCCHYSLHAWKSMLAWKICHEVRYERITSAKHQWSGRDSSSAHVAIWTSIENSSVEAHTYLIASVTSHIQNGHSRID